MEVLFESEKLWYRRLGCEDESLFVDLYTNQSTMKFIGEPLTPEQASKFFKHHLKPWKFEHKRFYYMVAIHKSNQEPIGLCGVATRQPHSHQGEVGVMLLPEYTSQGLGTELLTALTGHCFESLGYNKLWGPPMVDNVGSIRIMEKSGYFREGTFRQQYYIDGQYHDAPFYTILRKEYENPEASCETSTSDNERL